MVKYHYLESKDNYLDLAFNVFEKYFKDKTEFTKRFEKIKTKKKQDMFLKASYYYKYQIKDCEFTVDNNGVDSSKYKILDISYKFIAIISLIEFLYSEEKHQKFFDWLRKNENEELFPLKKQEDLDPLYEEYNDVYGARRKARKFFNLIGPEGEILIRKTVKKYRIQKNYENYSVKGEVLSPKPEFEEPMTIDDFSNLLYQTRSKLVHEAKLPNIPNEGFILFKEENRFYISNFQLDDLLELFETCLLTFFNFDFR